MASILLTCIVLWALGPTRLLVYHTFLYFTLTCIALICLLYNGTRVYSFILKNTILLHSVFLTWYQSHLLMAIVFCPYGIFKSNLCLPQCFLRCVHLLWLPTAAVKTLQYSQAIVRSRINIARPLPSSNYRHRAKLDSRDLLNLIKSQDFIKLPS